MKREKIQNINYLKLAFFSSLVGLISCILAYSLKLITEKAEEFLFEKGSSNIYLFILFPSMGITIIYFLRKYLFKNRKNKGIAEIYKTIDLRKDHLPFFKIPSHYFNGFLTVVFGGSTGIEVSTVVATATVGNNFYEKISVAKSYKLELICAGVCSGISILFGSPFVGWLFAIEVIARKMNRTLAISCTFSAIVSWFILFQFPISPIINIPINHWSWFAIPFMLVLGLISGLLSAYFTLLVVHIKDFFNKISNNFLRVNLGAILVGIMITFSSFLYGDSYHSLNVILKDPFQYSILFLILLSILKPLASSLTLGAGGDGGVFAPSIVAGAYLGIAFAMFCNSFFHTNFIIINFALIGAAATLSTSIYAPFTTFFLICNLVPNGYNLAFPILLVSLTTKFFTKKFILPYNVYTYITEKSKQKSI